MGFLRYGYIIIPKFICKIVSFCNKLMHLIIVLYNLVLKIVNLRALFLLLRI
jgi:hypothetical protein